MKGSLLLLGFFVLALAKANSQQPAVIDSTVVVDNNIQKVMEKQKPADAVKDFFSYFHKKDTTTLRSMMVEHATLNSLIISESRGTKVVHTPISDFLKGIAQIPDSVSFEEQLIQIRVTNSSEIASVSATYEFYMNEGFSHNGTNIFTLIYIDDKWKITSITDTRQYP